MRRAALLAGCALLMAGCGSSAPARSRRVGGIPPALLAGLRPIGRGPRFQPPPGPGATGACRAPLGRRLQAHIELFARNRVVLLATGIGARRPRRISDGRLASAGCFGSVVTVDPTGTVYFRPSTSLTVGSVFKAWGQPLAATRLASFSGGRVRIYIDGRRRRGSPQTVPLTDGAELVLEIGPQVPPHAHFTFPAAPSSNLR